MGLNANIFSIVFVYSIKLKFRLPLINDVRTIGKQQIKELLASYNENEDNQQYVTTTKAIPEVTSQNSIRLGSAHRIRVFLNRVFGNQGLD